MANLLGSRISCAALLCAGLLSPTAALAARTAPATDTAPLPGLAPYAERMEALKRSLSPAARMPLVDALRATPDAAAMRLSSPQARPLSSKTFTIPAAGHAGLTEHEITEWDNDADGSADQRLSEVRNIDPQGNVVRLATRNEDLASATVTTSVELTSFNSRGNPTQYSRDVDDDGDGTVDGRTTTTYEYDSRGRETSKIHRMDTPIGGPLESSQTNTTEYDNYGNITMLDIVTNASGQIYHEVNRATYDSQGHPLTGERTIDADSDGVLEYKLVSVVTYDSRGNQLTAIAEEDDGADGTIDNRLSVTNVYDQRSNLLDSVTEGDNGANGSIDVHVHSAATYDSRGNMVSQETVQTEQGTVWGYSGEFTYDERGRLIRDVTRTHPTDPAEPDRVTITEYTFDARGNFASSVITDDYDDDGVPDRVDSTVSEHDAHGNQTSSVYGADFNGNGTVDYQQIVTATYDSHNREKQSTLAIDQDADGTPNYLVTRTTAYTIGINQDIPVAGKTDSGPMFRTAGPNPFQEGSSFLISVPNEGDVELAIYDASGRLVRSLSKGTRPAGEVQVVWDGRDDQSRQVPNGAYFARLRAGGQVMTRTLFRMR